MYKTAVIGTGIMGMNHARVLSEVSRLAGICDVNDGAGRAAGKRFSVPASSHLGFAVNRVAYRAIAWTLAEDSDPEAAPDPATPPVGRPERSD